MRRFKGIFDARLGLGALALALLICNMPEAAAQSDQRDPDEHVAAAKSAPSFMDTAVIRGQAFSAIRYARTVKVLPDGKEQFIRNERYPTRVARDSDGRIYMQFVDNPPQPECDHPESQKPPLCSAWAVLVFDPTTHTVTHWPEGELAAHGAVILTMSADQVNQAEKSTTAMPAHAPAPDSDATTVTTEDLGEETVDGVLANGTRTTTVISAAHAGTKKPIITIHEIWISTEMNLIVKIIDGNPHGKETISGLEHISLQPGTELFLPPDDYKMEGPREEGKYLEGDMSSLADWFVSQPATP